jgi:hypothetical protein
MQTHFLKKKVLLALTILAPVSFGFVAGCTKSSDSPAAAAPVSAELTAMTRARSATQAAATNSNGLTKGAGITVGLLNEQSPMAVDFDFENECATSGWPTETDKSTAGYAMKFLICSVLKSPNGPDTVRGGFDRIAGFLCAIGPIAYDGVEKSVSVTFSTACFSADFTEDACSYISGTTTAGPCTATATVAGYSDVTGVAPAGFEKYVTFSALDGEVKYTFAHQSTATTIAGAAMEGLPSTADGSVESAFAFYIDQTSGTLRYEGRFPEGNKRHIRINLVGEVSTAMEVTNVESLAFVQGENFSTSGGGQIISINGTPSAGRRVRIRQSSGGFSPATWSAVSADDNSCIGESSATCTANTGIVAADGTSNNPFFFVTGSGYTSSKTWFTSNSYLGGVSDTLDLDDLWN